MSIRDLAKANAYNICDLCDEIGINQVTEAYVDGYNYATKVENPWRNFKNERPKPNSHILRKMDHPGYKSYGKVIYYADFWTQDRPDTWEQEDDRIIYEWKYIDD